MERESKRISRLVVFLAVYVTQIRGWTTTSHRMLSRRNACQFRSNPSENDENLHNLRKLLSPSEKCQVDQMSSTDLAYVGDAVYELLIRSTKVWPSKRTSDLQSQVVSVVRGAFRPMYMHASGANSFRSPLASLCF